MARRLDGNEFKVDATTADLYLPNRRKKKLVIFNFNIPVAYVRDDAIFLNALERIQNFVAEDFFGREEEAVYQISSSFFLLNRETGERRLWTGSFYFEHNASIIADFVQFNSATFVRQVFDNCEDAEEKLTWRDRDTKWLFDGLRSIIICVQAQVDENDRLLLKRNLRGKVQQTIAM